MSAAIRETIEPASINELAEAVRAHNHAAIYPIGCGSWMDLGYPPSKPGVAISTKKLNRVVDYPHEELTITVEAGILISELQRILAEKRQMLPIDCPHPENATLGGLLATNTSGPRRLAYGTARDSVLGLDVIDATGTRIHGGGRVVKNVAGFDLPKMHIGALGTLGIIVEATLKVRPMPEATVVVEFDVEPSGLEESLTAIRKSKLRPTGVEMKNAPSIERFVLTMLFEECPEAVEFQLSTSSQLAPPLRRLSLRESSRSKKLEDFRGAKGDGGEEISDSMNMAAKLTMRPTDTASPMQSLLTTLPNPVLVAHAMNGVVWASWNAESLHSAKEQVSAIRSAASEFGGRFTIPRCPDEWKRELPIWGNVGPEIEWMRRLRTALDPNRVINPSRFVVE